MIQYYKNSFYFLLFFTICFSAITLINNYSKLILSELLIYYFYLSLIVFIEYLFLNLIIKFIFKFKKVYNLFTIFILTFNIYLVNLIFIFDSNKISNLLRSHFTIYIDLILLIPFSLIFYLILVETQNNLKFRLYCFLICLILSISPIYLNLTTKNKEIVKDKNYVNKIYKDSNIQKRIILKKRPNIYILGLDSLIPESIAKKHLNIKELSYIDKLNNSFILKNSFTQNFPTEGTVNSILNLDTKQFDDLTKKNNLNFPNIVSGKIYSNLIKIFRDNNYISSFYHPGYNFGYQRSSPNFDFYQTKSEKLFEGSFCNYNVFFRKYHLIGFCFVSQIFKKDEASQNYEDFLKNLKLQTSKPSINLSYFFMPGHADTNNYDHKNIKMRNEFKNDFEKESKKVANFLTNLTKYLETTEENYIFIVYGDHGPWLSANSKFSDNQRFYIESRYAVHISIGPKINECSKSIVEEKLDFVTINMVLAKVIRCLSGSEVFIDQPNYNIVQDYIKDDDNKLKVYYYKKPLNYIDYLYE